MLATYSNLRALVTTAKRAAATRGIDEATLYSRAGVTQAQVDALYTQLGNVDHATLIRLLNVPRIFIGAQTFNGYFDNGGGGKGSDNVAVTHNESISSVYGDLSV